MRLYKVVRLGNTLLRKKTMEVVAFYFPLRGDSWNAGPLGCVFHSALAGWRCLRNSEAPS